ncbi:MAG: 30S ribosomal protein S24e [archaeon]|nr:30S ribosomal protein S24e [Candidatus Micrarchaeota archaeon]
MKIEIIKRKSNPLLLREEIEFKVIDINITPSVKAVREKISAALEKKPETVVIARILQKHGRKEVECSARVYESIEKMKEVELSYTLEKNFEEEKEKGKKKREEKKALKEKQKLEKKKK